MLYEDSKTTNQSLLIHELGPLLFGWRFYAVRAAQKRILTYMRIQFENDRDYSVRGLHGPLHGKRNTNLSA